MNWAVVALRVLEVQVPEQQAVTTMTLTCGEKGTYKVTACICTYTFALYAICSQIM